MKLTLRMALTATALVVPLIAAIPAGAAAEEKKTDGSAWKVARTAWGDPDLRGRWPIDYLAQTPRQRPAQYGTRGELSEEEYAAALKNAETQKQLYDRENKIGKMGMGHWTERGLPLRQTSLT